MKKVILIITLLALVGCEASPQSLNSPPTPTNTIQAIVASSTSETPKNIEFKISSFTIDYKKESNASFFDETYTGNGIVTATGDPSLVNKPYYLLLQIKKVKGGDKRTFETHENIVVMNGIGRFTTTDWSYDKTVILEKPEYDIKIIGYIPYNEVQTSSK